MKIKQLIEKWKSERSSPGTTKSFTIELPAIETAKLLALAEMFPSRTEEQIVAELISASLNEIEETFPYVQGTKVIRMDEFNDPIYEDIGLTPVFEELIRKHMEILRNQDNKQ